MVPIPEDPWFTFRFADDRIIPRFHLEGVEARRQASFFKIRPSPADSGVDLDEPIIVRVREASIAVLKES